LADAEELKTFGFILSKPQHLDFLPLLIRIYESADLAFVMLDLTFLGVKKGADLLRLCCVQTDFLQSGAA
jgi:hypothetical protein